MTGLTRDAATAPEQDGDVDGLTNGSPALAPGCLVAIGTAAGLAGVSERTLRYYEEIGLVTPAAHSPGGSRRYAAEQVERVRRIRELQELLGLNLEEIRALLERDDRREVLRAAWVATEDAATRRAILDEAISSNVLLRHRLVAKRDRIDGVITDLDCRLERYRELLARCDELVSSDVSPGPADGARRSARSPQGAQSSPVPG
jgi:DNA-binding transcriptional MerR regulator